MASSTSSIKDLSVKELGDFLLSKHIPQDVVDNINEHGVNGETLLIMTSEHLKEISPRIVDRISLEKIVSDEKVSWLANN